MGLTHTLPADGLEAPALLRARFGAHRFEARAGPGGLDLEVPVASLQRDREEAWQVAPVTGWGQDEAGAWAAAGPWIAVALWAAADPDLEGSAHRLYGLLLDRVAAHGAHLCRVWHHVPRINEGEGDDERYRRFNAGRARALDEAWGAEAPARYPAASAVGAEGDRLALWALAGPDRGTLVENPRQLAAWTYPPVYGPRPPCFSRAVALPGGPALISGTAAVVGHRTLHPGDVQAQLGPALDNLDAVRGALPGRYEPEALKAYLRRPGDAGTVRAVLAARRPGVPALLLRADICRADLEVEIEETCRPV